MIVGTCVNKHSQHKILQYRIIRRISEMFLASTALS